MDLRQYHDSQWSVLHYEYKYTNTQIHKYTNTQIHNYHIILIYTENYQESYISTPNIASNFLPTWGSANSVYFLFIALFVWLVSAIWLNMDAACHFAFCDAMGHKYKYNWYKYKNDWYKYKNNWYKYKWSSYKVWLNMDAASHLAFCDSTRHLPVHGQVHNPIIDASKNIGCRCPHHHHHPHHRHHPLLSLLKAISGPWGLCWIRCPTK